MGRNKQNEEQEVETISTEEVNKKEETNTNELNAPTEKNETPTDRAEDTGGITSTNVDTVLGKKNGQRLYGDSDSSQKTADNGNILTNEHGKDVSGQGRTTDDQGNYVGGRRLDGDVPQVNS